jgi:hypothetical protein
MRISSRLKDRRFFLVEGSMSENELPPTFNAELYLRMHPDVRRANVDPAYHYLKYGAKEGRSLVPTLRREKMLSFVDYGKLGLEIGPSHSPICPKSEGYNVEILDHMSQSDLRKKYVEHGVDLAAIEQVDFVWHGESYEHLTGRSHEYGWVVASHVIEHTPDMISFLRGCDDVLDDEGALVLAIPDKRYCFDHLRPTTSLAAIIDAFEAKRTIHSVGTAAEYFLNVCQIEPLTQWSGATDSDLHFSHSLSDSLSAMKAVKEGSFLDLHSWCFTPSSFRLIVNDLFSLGLIRNREMGFFETVGHEFIIALGRSGTGSEVSRMNLALRALDE